MDNKNNYYYNKGYLQGVNQTIDRIEDLIYHDYNITLDILMEIKDILIYICLFIVSIGIYICNIFIQDKGVGSTYNLYFETNNVSLNIERLGVPAATYLDIYRSIFGFDEKIDVEKETLEHLKELKKGLLQQMFV